MIGEGRVEITQAERELLADTARAWARKHVPVSAYREVRDRNRRTGYDPELYAQMAEMGWPGMIAPAEHGGSELGFECLGLVVEQLGRTLAATPLVASAVAAISAIALGGNASQQAEWLPRLIDGTAVGTLATEEGRRHDLRAISMAATRRTGAWLLNGRKHLVEAGRTADVLVIAARTSGTSGDADGLSLFICDSATPGVFAEDVNELDVRGRVTVLFDNVELPQCQVLGQPGRGIEVLDQVLDRVRAVTAAEMLGGAQQAFETTVDYLKVRKQFGQLIGSFQALQHRAADLLADIELARVAVHNALRALDEANPRAPLLISMAKARTGTVFAKAAREMIQLHGGIGMTDEHDAGFYLKRSHALDAHGGNVAFHRERVAQWLGI